MDLSGCFKAYDVRGRIPDDLNPEVVYRIGRAYAEWLKPARVAVGRDIRHSSAEFADALMRGLTDSGVDVVDIGLCGTECVYFATFSLGLDGGVMVTASHNPPDYNGLKFVREQAKPVSGDTGLQDIRKLAEAGEFARERDEHPVRPELLLGERVTEDERHARRRSGGVVQDSEELRMRAWEEQRCFDGAHCGSLWMSAIVP